MEHRMKKKSTSFGRECVCYGCSNTQYSKDGCPSGISFFTFPQKNPKRNRWCNLIKRQHGRDGFSVNNLTVICEKHFEKEDICRSLGGTRKRLKTGAEPSIFPWQSSAAAKPKRRILVRKTNDCGSSVSSETCLSDKTDTNVDGMQIEGDILNVITVEDDSNISSLEVESVEVEPHFQEKAVQTDIGTDLLYAKSTHDHSYCFSFDTKRDTFGEQEDYINTLQEKLQRQSDIINDLQSKVGALTKQLEEYEKKKFTLKKFKDDDSAIQFYTGFPNYKALMAVYEYLEPKVGKLQYWRNRFQDSKNYQEKGKKPGPKRGNTALHEFWMVLVRLKVGLFVKDLADRFEITPGHFSKIFTTWINFLCFELKLIFPFPTQAEVLQNMPMQFASYPNTRVIIDCTEVFVQVPSSLKAQSQTWSNYKHHNTFKVLVAISPNGQVTFVSKLWGGRVSDKFITRQSGILDLLDAGDNIMADRGFDIKNILPPGVDLNLPPFKGQRDQLTAQEVEETSRIASVRIHVERAIGRIKNYHILDGVLPLSLSHVADQVFSVCSYLTNFLPPLLEPGGNEK